MHQCTVSFVSTHALDETGVALGEVGAHKLYPPPVRDNAIGRRALVERVCAAEERVVLLQAPAGNGKSTTLRQLLGASEEAGCRVGWLTFDDADNDPRRFEAHIHALVRGLLGGAPPLPVHEHEPVRASLANNLLDQLGRSPHPLTLCLDEFQVLRDEGILQFFRAFLLQLPPKVRVYIGSRALPEIGLATLLVKGMALVLRAEDLRFGLEETAAFFAQERGLCISVSEVERIHQRTEGWPAALQLFKLALASPSVRTSLAEITHYGPQELTEYLTDNVLSLQPQQVQDFLLRTSLLRRVSGPLCDAVVGRPGSHDLLSRLERSGLFLTALDAHQGWFKYHGLFAQILAQALRRSTPRDVVEVHARAARWHLAQDSYEEAVYHAVEAGEHALAADALDVWASRLIARGELVTVERWLDALPFDEIATRKGLSIKAAWVLTFLRRRAKLAPCIEHLKQDEGRGDLGTTSNPDVVLSMSTLFCDDTVSAAEIAAHVDLHPMTDGPFASFERGAAANLMAFADTCTGRFESPERLLTLARTHNRLADTAFSGGYTTACAGINLLVQGKLTEARREIEAEAGEFYRQANRSLAQASLASVHIWVLYEAGELASLETLALRFGADIVRSAVPEFIAFSHLAIARAHALAGRDVEAETALAALEQAAHTDGWPRLVQLADRERTRQALISGDTARAATIWRRVKSDASTMPPGWLPPSEAMEGHALGRIRLAIASHHHAIAARVITAEIARTPARAYYSVRLHVLDAILQRARGAAPAAHRSLRRALDLGQAGGLIRSLLDEGREVVELLLEEHRSLAERDDPHTAKRRRYIEALLGAAHVEVSANTVQAQTGGLTEPLSTREREILDFLCAGISNREMAQRLFVSENTVKFHLKNIYSKLEVTSRAQAIYAARHLQLARGRVD